jgi:ComF family protein
LGIAGWASSAAGGLVGGLLDATLPQTCAACGQWIAGSGGPVCAACEDEIGATLDLPYCHRCGRTLPPPALHEDGCARCKSERHWNVAGVARVGTYPSALRKLLLGLKYHGQERSASYLAGWLAAALLERAWVGQVEALVPVPMHWLRRWQRPCDHARLLTEALGKQMRLPVIRLVRRARHSPSQTGITSKSARFENVRGCFALRRGYWVPWPRPSAAGKTVCIIDNLMMTGATVAEVSKVLRRAGAKRIYAAVIARPAGPSDPPVTVPESPPS